MIASVVIAGIVRSYFIIYLMSKTYDNTWYLYKTWTWTVVELYVAIIAASAPALKPFFRRFLVEPLTSQPNGHGRDPASYPQTTRGFARPRLLGSLDEEKGDGSWSHDGGTWQCPGEGEEGEERMEMRLERHGGDGPEPRELKALSGAGDEAVWVNQVRPLRPLSMHPVSGVRPRTNSFTEPASA